MFLADINLWLALAFRSHIHHESGKNWFEGLSNDSCAFCRLTQQGFLRLATNPKAFGAEAVSMSDAWRMFDEFLGDPRVSFADEPANIEPRWRGYTQRRAFSPKAIFNRGDDEPWHNAEALEAPPCIPPSIVFGSKFAVGSSSWWLICGQAANTGNELPS